MSVLDELLDEVKAVAKNEALKDYETEIDNLRTVVDSMERQLGAVSTSNERWERAYRGAVEALASMQEKIQAVLDEC